MMQTTIKMNKNDMVMNTECLRDFCGGFYELAKKDHKDNILNRNYKLLYYIPEATLEYMKKEYADSKEAIKKYKELLTQGFESILFNDDAKRTIERVLVGELKSEDVSFDMIAKILDQYYIHGVPAAVESIAFELIRLEPIKKLMEELTGNKIF